MDNAALERNENKAVNCPKVTSRGIEGRDSRTRSLARFTLLVHCSIANFFRNCDQCAVYPSRAALVVPVQGGPRYGRKAVTPCTSKMRNKCSNRCKSFLLQRLYSYGLEQHGSSVALLLVLFPQAAKRKCLQLLLAHGQNCVLDWFLA